MSKFKNPQETMSNNFPITNGSKYIINLDNLDLSLLARSFNINNNGTVPIWTWNKKGFEYQQFEILTSAHNGKKYDTVQKCHLCNINVPTAFIKEHNDSHKHRTCLKISELALDRVKRHMSQDPNVIPPPDCPDDDSVYFCEPCAVAVNVINKKQHESSDEHAVSVKHDTLLNDLLLIYTDNCNVTCDNTEENNNVKKEVNITHDNDKTAKNVLINDALNNGEMNHAKNKTDINNDTINNTENKNNTETSSENTNLESYITFLNTKMGSAIFKAIGDTQLEIKTSSGAVVKVSIDSFHSFQYYTMMPSIVYCGVCSEKTTDVKKLEHIRNNDHVAKLIVPIDDEHCIRKFGQTWYHCIHCNMFMTNKVKHICQKDHLQKLKETTIIKPVPNKTHETEDKVQPNDPKMKLENDKKTEPNKQNPTEFKTQPNNAQKNVEDDTKAETNKIPQTEFKVHLQNTSKQQDKDRSKQQEKKDLTEILRIFSKLNMTGKEQIYCQNCKVTMNGIANVTQHLYGNNHAEHCINMMEKNSIQIGNLLYCQLCDSHFKKSTNSLWDHIKNETHEWHCKVFHNYFEDCDENMKCKICESIIPISGSNMVKHINSVDHIGRHGKLIKKNEIVKAVNVYRCLYCNVEIDDMEEICHIETERHKSALNTKLKMNKEGHYCDICKGSIPEPDVNDHFKGSTHRFNYSIVLRDKTRIDNHYLMMETDKPKQVLCKVCNVKVPKNLNNITSHVQGANHDNNLTTLMSTNHMDRVHNTAYYCGVCDKYVAVTNSVDHIATATHEICCW